jgi:DNA polymerase-1
VESFLAEFNEGASVCFDLETGTEHHEKALFPWPGNKIVAIGLSRAPGHARMIPYQARGIQRLTYWTPDEEHMIYDLFTDFWQKHTFFGHNAVQFDQKWVCAHWGHIDKIKIDFDTMYASHLLDEERGSHGLEYLTLKHTKMAPWKSTFNLKDTRRLCGYLARDVDATYRIRRALEPELNEAQQWLHRELQLPLGHIFRRMEWRGIKTSKENIEILGKELEEIIEKTKSDLKSMECVQAFELSEGKTFNANAPLHVAFIMEKVLGLPCIKQTGKGAYSTDREVLECYEDRPFVAALLTHRRAVKLHGTYYCNVEAHRRQSEYVHTTFLLHGTVTGRPASRDPNLLNQARPDTAKKAGLADGSVLKNIFIPRMGNVLLQVDFSQAELRTLAMYSQDENLIQIYQEDRDIHTETAARVFEIPVDQVDKGQRSKAKNVNFGVIYGLSEESLNKDFIAAARQQARKEERKFTGNDINEAAASAQRFYHGHQAAYPKVWAWMAEQERLVRTQGYQETFFGRRRRYYKVNKASIRQAYNFPIQSSASEFTLISLCRLERIFKDLNYKAIPILTVYDSIVWDCPYNEIWDLARICKEVMENLNFPFMAGVPMKVDCEMGLKWGKLKNIDPENELVEVSKGQWKKISF